MRKPWLSWWLGLAVTWVGAQHAAPLHAQEVAPRIEVVPHEDLRRVDVLVDGKPFTSYIWPTTLKKPALYRSARRRASSSHAAGLSTPGRESASITRTRSGSGSITGT